MMMHKRYDKVAKSVDDKWVVEDVCYYQWRTNSGEEVSEWFNHIRGAIDFIIDYDIARNN
jgi:hypothetical protein